MGLKPYVIPQEKIDFTEPISTLKKRDTMVPKQFRVKRKSSAELTLNHS